MRVRLKLNSGRRETTMKELESLGIEISEEADLILTEEGFREGELNCREGEDTRSYYTRFKEYFGI